MSRDRVVERAPSCDWSVNGSCSPPIMAPHSLTTPLSSGKLENPRTPRVLKNSTDFASTPKVHQDDDTQNQKLWMDEVRHKIVVAGSSVQEFLDTYMPCATNLPAHPEPRADLFAQVPIYVRESSRNTTSTGMPMPPQGTRRAVVEADMYDPIVRPCRHT